MPFCARRRADALVRRCYDPSSGARLPRHGRDDTGEAAEADEPAGQTGQHEGTAANRGGSGGGIAFFGGGGTNQRFNLEFYVQASNVLNRTNFSNFSGSLLSPIFGTPTSAGPARRAEVGLQFRF